MKIDTNYKTQQQLLDEIVNNFHRLENGELTLSELSCHLELIRILYERTVVLQYKAFEKHSSENQSPPSQTDINDNSDNTEVVEPISIQTVLEFDFSDNIIKDTREEPIDMLFDEKKETATSAELPVADTQTKEKSLIHERFFSILDSVSNNIGRSSFTTLSDSFGLNERLFFINELFAGSGEDFVRAIEFLETIPIPESTVSFFEELSKEYNWDLDNQAVNDFMLKICRKYV